MRKSILQHMRQRPPRLANDCLLYIIPLLLLEFHLTTINCIHDNQVLANLQQSSHLMGDQILQETPPSRCQPVDTLYCNINNYETLANFNNSLGHKTKAEANGELSKFAFLFGNSTCREYIQPFLCSLYLPNCYAVPDGAPVPEILLPCQFECRLAKLACEQLLIGSAQRWPDIWDCETFPPEDPCFYKHRNQTSIPVQLVQPGSPDDGTGLIGTVGGGGGFDGLVQASSSVCGESLFDCQLRDPNDPGRKALCIEKAFVCDGNIDCIYGDRQDEPSNGLDEMNCPMSTRQPTNSIYCPDGSINCTNEDYIDTIMLLQCILCIVVLPTLAIYLLVRFCRACNETEKPPPAYEHTVVPYMESVSQQTPHAREHTYQIPPSRIDDNEPAQQYYHTTDNSVYERVNSGGYSGLSSIYDSYMQLPLSTADSKEYQHHHHHQQRHHNKDDYLGEPPAPPPPTPALPSTPAQQSIYLNSDCMPMGMNHFHM